MKYTNISFKIDRQAATGHSIRAETSLCFYGKYLATTAADFLTVNLTEYFVIVQV